MPDDDTTANEVTIPAGLSILEGLDKRREQILETVHLDLAVPRWEDPEIIVRFRPAEHSTIRRLADKAEKAPKAQRPKVEVEGNMDLLIGCCVGVVGRVNGQDYSLRPGDPNGEPTVFDADLAANLGLSEGATARQVVRALYFTDGDILSCAQALIEWSGYRQTEADTELAGE